MKTNEAVNPVELSFKSIIVAIDFSETSIKALEYATALAREFGSHLRLLHILEFPAVFNSPKPVHAQWDQRVKETSSQRLSELMAEKVDKAISVEVEVRTGRAYQTICEVASKQKADLIVLGTHGFTGVKHLLLGSTAERVVRHAPCSVLTIKPQTDKKPVSVVHPKKILVPTDFSSPAQAAFRAALVLAEKNGAEIQLLYVIPVHYAVGEYDAVDYPALEVEENDAAEKEFSSMNKIVAAKNLAVRTEIRRGRPAVEINEVAEEFGSDLIVIATHGRTGWQTAVLGSTTEEVIRHSICPVLTVRNP